MTRLALKSTASLLCAFAMLMAASNASYAYSGVFLIKVTGALEHVVFNFYVSDNANSASEERLTSLTVQKRTTDGWKLAWRIQGKSLISSVSYGEIPSGMTQDAKAIKFSKDCKYRIIATSNSAFGPILYATSYFAFDKNGNAVPSPRTP